MRTLIPSRINYDAVGGPRIHIHRLESNLFIFNEHQRCSTSRAGIVEFVNTDCLSRFK